MARTACFFAVAMISVRPGQITAQQLALRELALFRREWPKWTAGPAHSAPILLRP